MTTDDKAPNAELAPVHVSKFEVSKGEGLGSLVDVEEGRRRLDAIAVPMPVDVVELEELRALVRFIAADYHELSAEKTIWQRDDWKRRCKALVEKYRQPPR